jgi:hypothetical protein
LGPHMLQKCAIWAPSAGSVSSWYASAVTGSSARLNWSRQRNSKRALLSVLSHLLRARMPLREIGRVCGDLVRDHPFRA